MKKFAPLLALLAVGVALAAEPVVVVLTDPADIEVVAKSQAAVDAEARVLAVFQDRVAKSQATLDQAKAARSATLAAVASKLGVSGKSFSVEISGAKKGDGAEVRTISIVATQE